MGLRKFRKGLRNKKPSIMLGRPIAREPKWENQIKVVTGFFELMKRGYTMNPNDLLSLEWTGHTVAASRNAIANACLVDNFDYLLFVDDDMTFFNMADDVEKMIDLDKDIVVAIGVTKGKPHFPNIGKVTKIGKSRTFSDSQSTRILEWPEKPFQVDTAGGAYMLIKRKVLEKMSKPWFYMPPNHLNGNIKGEDTTFCFNARMHGFEIWCDPNIRLGHIGDFAYESHYRSTCFLDFKDEIYKNCDNDPDVYMNGDAKYKGENQDFTHNLIPSVVEQFKKAEGPGVTYA